LAESIKISKEMLYGVVIVVLAALLVVSVFTGGFVGLTQVVGGTEGASAFNMVKLSDSELKSKAQAYINQYLLDPAYLAEATNISAYDNYMSVVGINILQNNSVLQADEVYITNDGSSLFVGNAFKLDVETPATNPTTQTNATGQTTIVSQTDKPEAHAFVMAFCPYGLQFLKAYVQVMELLGDKADMEVNFVYYGMHGASELVANNYIYCAQEKEPEKFTQYLRCFVQAEDYAGCVAAAGLDSATIETCVADLQTQYGTDSSYPQYSVEAALNQQYGVGGSPTFILNGQRIDYTSCSSDADCNAGTVCTATSSGQKCILNRNPEAIKEAICSAFTTMPEECSTELSTTNEAPGAGAVGSGSSGGSSASCG